MTERRAEQIRREFRANQALWKIREACKDNACNDIDDFACFHNIVDWIIAGYFANEK